MRIKTIVTGLALEVDDDPVAARAIQLARQHDARLVVVHAIEDPAAGEQTPPLPADPQAVLDVLATSVRNRLETMFAVAACKVEILIEADRAHEMLEQAVTDHRADLLVIGPGKTQSIRDRIFGSTANRVVRAAPCPVLVVKRPVAGPYRQAVAAIDFSPSAAVAARHAALLAPEALLDLVHAVDIPLPFEQAMLKTGTPQAEIDQYRKARANAARKDLRQLLFAQHGFPKGTRLRVVHAAATRALVREARRRRTDLVALGAQGAKPVSRFFLGSVARKVLEAATCDVLIARSRTPDKL